jgi:hypothetical protein
MKMKFIGDCKEGYYFHWHFFASYKFNLIKYKKGVTSDPKKKYSIFFSNFIHHVKSKKIEKGRAIAKPQNSGSSRYQKIGSLCPEFLVLRRA